MANTSLSRHVLAARALSAFRTSVRANPDGYTLLLGTTNNFVINQFMFPKQPVDPLSSLTLITKLVSGPLVVYVNPGVPARTFGEFISYAKAHPGKLKLRFTWRWDCATPCR